MLTSGLVMIETDSQELTSLWRKRATQRSEFASIFREIEALTAAFSSFSVQHVSHSANKAAHACAKFVAASAFEVWANDPPSFLVPLLHYDCNLMNE
jgi:hypothetical protein